MSITFVSIFLEALPFMLLGALIGGFIEVFVSKTVITRIVPARRLPAILLTAALGLVFPVCECAIVPVVRRLFSKGLPLGAGIAFLLGGPIVNPLVALSTAVAYGNDPAIAGYRLASGYLIAVVMGLLIDSSHGQQPWLNCPRKIPDQRMTVAVNCHRQPELLLKYAGRSGTGRLILLMSADFWCLARLLPVCSRHWWPVATWSVCSDRCPCPFWP